MELGTFEHAAEGMTVRFERRLPRPPEIVWAALTAPERLADWLGPAVFEPREGGRVNIFTDREEALQVHGRVTEWDPPRSLGFTWRSADEPETRVRCELSPDGPDGTRLVFTHGPMERKWIALVLPGWHGHLEQLQALIETGEPAASGMDRWRELQGAYVEAYALHDAMLDPPHPIEKYE